MIETTVRGPLSGMFAKVPSRYDFLNRLLTLRRDVHWRDLAAREILRGAPRRFLDLGCGTGDFAVHVARHSGPELAITGVDFIPAMLASAGEKARKAGVSGRIDWVAADAAQLPFPDGHFDAVGLAFSFRNLTHRNPGRDRHMAEIARVTRPGGKLVIIETSQPGNRLVRAGFHLYMRGVVARVGGILSDRGAYQYLAESAIGFMAPGEAGDLLERSGFAVDILRPLAGGIASLIAGTRRGRQ